MPLCEFHTGTQDQLYNQSCQSTYQSNDTGHQEGLFHHPKINPFPTVVMVFLETVCSPHFSRVRFLVSRQPAPFSSLQPTLVCLIKHLLLNTFLCPRLNAFLWEKKDRQNCYLGNNNSRMKQVSNLYDILTSQMSLEKQNT